MAITNRTELLAALDQIETMAAQAAPLWAAAMTAKDVAISQGRNFESDPDYRAAKDQYNVLGGVFDDDGNLISGIVFLRNEIKAYYQSLGANQSERTSFDADLIKLTDEAFRSDGRRAQTRTFIENAEETVRTR